MKGLTLVLAIVSFLLYSSVVYADIYMHNPAGSNNRNCERNENRNNGARLFDSQNNGKGGYACPRAVGGPEVDSIDKRMFYYQGSLLQVEWTSQHSCGATNNYCHIVLQYACEDSLPGLRDGQPKDENDAATSTIELDDEDNLNYGKHENGTYYKKCLKRYRQGGLFVADRQTENPGRLKSNSPATQTRQNPNGARSGLECPEERDYYPYWHPTPWRDIAIFTNDLSQCNMYRSESQNVKDKGECYDEKDNSYMSHNNYFDCTTNGGVWKESGRWGVSPPECLSTDLIKAVDNSLGNTDNGNMAKYIWKIPYDIASDSCVLRIRYNISTDDVPFDLDHKYNNEASPIKQDPFDTFGHNSFLSIAANTDQFGRTFQDRSYVFSIKERPAKTSGKIWNVNVKGKRGNIVQTYPAVEYKFVPEYLEVASNDWIHFQWTGSDYNPDRDPNNAEGGPVDKADKSDNPATRADRSNLVQLDYAGTSVPRPAQFNTMFVNPSTGKPDMTLINKFALINQDLSKCLSWEDLLAANNNNKDKAEKDSRNCAKLNAADHPYFNGGLVKLHASGTFHYFSSRNNNFSNRGQKATIRVVGGNIAGASTLSSTMAFIVTVMSVMFLYIW